MLSGTKKKILIGTSVIALMVMVVFFMGFRSDFKSLSLGLVLGVLIGLLNFMDLANTMERAVLKNPGKAQSYAIKKYFFRYITTGVVLYIAVITPHLHVIGTVIGMMLIKLSVLVTHLFNDKRFYKEIIKRKEV